MPTFCPVCGYDLAVSDPDVHPDPCPCCAFRFADLGNGEKHPYSDFFDKTSDLRFQAGIVQHIWAEAHLPWRSRTIPKPDGWDPIVQLKNIGVNMGTSYDEWMDRNPVIIPENKDKFLKLIREHIQKLGWTPQFIEALWDGDTQGWFLDICVSAKRDDGTFDKAYLRSLRGRGGDFRLFKGTVPPYPEAVIGRYLLDEIAKEYNIPSYFPAPDEPDDCFVAFWQRDDTKCCRTCGKHMNIYSIPFSDGKHMMSSGDQCKACKKRDGQAKKST